MDALTPEELISIIREAGIVGMGGASFPTHVKLSGGIGKVDTVIVNAGECEPYITADDRLCREMPEELISGLQVIMKILGLKEAHIGMEDNKPAAIEKLQKVADEVGDGTIKVMALKSRYPQGAEKMLVHSTTKRVVKEGELPLNAGCLVMNVTTIGFLNRYFKSTK